MGALSTMLLINFGRILLGIFNTLPELYSSPVCSFHWRSGLACLLPFSEGLFQRRCNLQRHIPAEPGTQTQSNPSGKYQSLWHKGSLARSPWGECWWLSLSARWWFLWDRKTQLSWMHSLSCPLKTKKTDAISLLVPQNDGSNAINQWAKRVNILKDKAAGSPYSQWTNHKIGCTINGGLENIFWKIMHIGEMSIQLLAQILTGMFIFLLLSLKEFFTYIGH